MANNDVTEENLIHFPIEQILSYSTSFTSIILGILAFILSLWFFKLSKDSESQVSKSLAEIKTQTQMLQQITASQLDRLTEYVTQQQPNLENNIAQNLQQMLNDMPDRIGETLANSINLQSTDNQALRRELVDAYIALRHYTGQTNVWAQYMLPYNNNQNPENELFTLAKRTVDISYRDFQLIQRIFNDIPEQDLNNSSLSHLILKTNITQIKDTEGVLSSRGIHTTR
jgi:lipopolysaccharide export LptBFGC system permease protein LptF